jgi:hypothetical protein
MAIENCFFLGKGVITFVSTGYRFYEFLEIMLPVKSKLWRDAHRPGSIRKFKNKNTATGFLLRILWQSQSGNHSQNNLAKFGYILDMKVEKKPESFYVFWLPTGTYHKNLAIRKIKIFKIWRIWVIFSMKTPLCRLKSFFQSEIWQKLLGKETLQTVTLLKGYSIFTLLMPFKFNPYKIRIWERVISILGSLFNHVKSSLWEY